MFKCTVCNKFKILSGGSLLLALTDGKTIKKKFCRKCRDKILEEMTESVKKEAPRSACPKCGNEEEDMDGFGFIHCDVCGHCIHPARTKNEDGAWACDICGKKTNTL